MAVSHRETDAGAERDASLLLDLPLGVHPDGFDTWRHRSAFVEGATAGAPPDPRLPRYMATARWTYSRPLPVVTRRVIQMQKSRK